MTEESLDHVCPVLASNYPACGCAPGDCDAFLEFGMACDNCDDPGHREADGWTLNEDGSVWCERCVRAAASSTTDFERSRPEETQQKEAHET